MRNKLFVGFVGDGGRRAADGGRRAVGGGRRTADGVHGGGRRTADGGRWAVGGGRRTGCTAGGGRWAVGGGLRARRTAGGGRWAAGARWAALSAMWVCVVACSASVAGYFREDNDLSFYCVCIFLPGRDDVGCI